MILPLRRWSVLCLLTWALVACAGADAAIGRTSLSPAVYPVSSPALTDAARRADAHLQLALAYYQQAQWPTALDEVALALQSEPQLADGYSMRGLILMASGRAALAGAEFQQALRLAPGHPDYLNNYGWFLCRQGQPRASLAWFERAAAQPGYSAPARALNNAGVCSEMAGEPAAAKAYFMQAAAQAPDYQRGVFDE